MDYSFIWKTIILFLVGKIIMSIGGRKIVSQMNQTQMIAMIGFGTVLVGPLKSTDIWTTLLTLLLLIILMIIFEYLEAKFKTLEKMLEGKSMVVIENGQINTTNLKKLRLTIDKLEMQLRTNAISSIDDILYATVEPNGEIGYILKENKRPLTKDDLKMLSTNENLFNNIKKR